MENQLSYLDNSERLQAYKTITEGCHHLWSKNKLQTDRLKTVLDNFVLLAEKDPYFLAHFTSYAIRKLDSKDLKVVATFINSLSDADGTPFSPGSSYKKPNLRMISQAALQDLDPKLVDRVVHLANMKMKIGSLSDGTHFSTAMKTAVRKYMRYRENNIKAIENAKKAGMSNILKNIYRSVHIAPTVEAATFLNWKQKDGRKLGAKKNFFDFKGMSDFDIAQKIRNEQLHPTGVLGALPDKISPVVAAAILEQSSGDQAIVLTNMFESQGLLKNKEVKSVYEAKIKTSKTALDRVERIKKELDKDLEETLKKAKAEKRKEDVGDIGRIFMHIDISGSMEQAIEVAIDSGAIVAECVKNPQSNFHWGLFNTVGRKLPTPPSFEKDAFKAALYKVQAGGGTNCLALYPEARRLGCDVDVFVTDQGHTETSMTKIIEDTCKKGYAKPKAALIINVGNVSNALKNELEKNGIPVTELTPKTLKESALVSQAIKTALKGATAIIDEIMNEPLLDLPKWWYSVK